MNLRSRIAIGLSHRFARWASPSIAYAHFHSLWMGIEVSKGLHASPTDAVIVEHDFDTEETSVSLITTLTTEETPEESK